MSLRSFATDAGLDFAELFRDASQVPQPLEPDELTRLLDNGLAASPLSQNEAAKRAGLNSGTRWRQIANGYSQPASGVRAPVKRDPRKIAAMAHVLGIGADELREIGQDEAAVELERLARSVRGSGDDPEDVRFRRPVGMSDDEWLTKRSRLEGFWAAMLDDAETER